MDKNTIFGLVLIFVILITFSYLNKPSQQEIDAAKRKSDSIAQVDSEKQNKPNYSRII
jgi:YidC/Oxa1 family membrane protein insertase